MAERVAIVSSSYPATEADPSGHFVQAHARKLAREGHQVCVAAPGPLSVRLETCVLVKRLGATSLFGWPGAVARLRENPLRLAQLGPFAVRARDILHEADRIVSHFLLPCGFPICVGLRAPVEHWAHGSDVRLLMALPLMLRSEMVRSLLSSRAQVVFVSAALRSQLMDGLDGPLGRQLRHQSRIEQPPIEVPDKALLPDPRSQIGLCAKTPYVVWVGRPIASKRLGLALEVARSAQVKLLCMGVDKQRVPSPALGLGVVPRHFALAVVAHAAALLATSEAEGAPTVVREARALGTPVVATPAGELADWARNDPGIHLCRTDTELPALLRRIVTEQTGTGRLLWDIPRF